MVRHASSFLQPLRRTSVLLLASGSVIWSSPAAADAPRTVVATVCAVDAKALTIELVTGVGHALRLIQVSVAAECEIRGAETPARLADLRAGNIVRVRAQSAPATSAPARTGAAPWVAVSIECLPGEGMGAAR
jgi:hypothetical protein